MSGGEQESREKPIVMLLQNNLLISSNLWLRDLLSQTKYSIFYEFLLLEILQFFPELMHSFSTHNVFWCSFA